MPRKEIVDGREYIYPDEDNKISYTGNQWFLVSCLHQKAFEVYLPLVKLFRFEFLKYKQYVCPDCKEVNCTPNRGFTFSKGDGSTE